MVVHLTLALAPTNDPPLPIPLLLETLLVRRPRYQKVPQDCVAHWTRLGRGSVGVFFEGALSLLQEGFVGEFVGALQLYLSVFLLETLSYL